MQALRDASCRAVQAVSKADRPLTSFQSSRLFVRLSFYFSRVSPTRPASIEDSNPEDNRSGEQYSSRLSLCSNLSALTKSCLLSSTFPLRQSPSRAKCCSNSWFWLATHRFRMPRYSRHLSPGELRVFLEGSSSVDSACYHK